GAKKTDLGREDLDALRRGRAKLRRQVGKISKFGVPPIVAINHFTSDTEAEHKLIAEHCKKEFGVDAVQCRHWANGSKGTAELAEKVSALADGGTAKFKPLYTAAMPLAEKMRVIAREIYGAADIAIESKAAARLAEIEAMGFGELPVCVAKTQYSFAADPSLLGAPSGHVVPVREVRLSAGAGFVVMICGDIMTMPGLPRRPAAERIGLDANGAVDGLF
ncbi:MAG: formate--tetrahydrofolate ligase, partial [Hyphomicrobiales bacterium]